MYKDLDLLLGAAAIIGALSLSGCSSSTTGTPGSDAGCPATQAGCPAKDAGCPAVEAGCPAASATTNAGTPDLPATGSDADVRAWLARNDFKAGTWKCEAAPHSARSPSPHGMNRICSNATLSAHGAGEFPVGAAAVKELYDDSGATLIGHAVYRKLKAGAGESFYWWEDSNGATVANGTGDQGAAKMVCVGCHAGAGSDANHSGHDFVYTQAK
jgi:hypothetical protein